MASSASIKQALGLEDLKEGDVAPATVFTPEEEHLIVNDVDVTELVDDIRADSETNSSLESLAETFNSLHAQILRTSLEAFDEPATTSMLYCAVNAAFNGTVPTALKKAYDEGDTESTLTLSTEAVGNTVNKIVEAVSKGIKFLIEKLKALYEKITARLSELAPFIDRAIARVSEIAKKHPKQDVKLSYDQVATLGRKGVINDSAFAKDIKDLSEVGKYITETALSEVEAFTTKVQTAIKAADGGGPLFEAIKAESLAISPKGKGLEGNYIGDYDGELRDDVFTFTFSGKVSRSVEAQTVSIELRNVVAALYAVEGLAKVSTYKKNLLDNISHEQAKTHLQLVDAEMKEGFGSTRNSATLYNKVVRARLTNVAAYTVHSTKLIQVLVRIANQMKLDDSVVEQ